VPQPDAHAIRNTSFTLAVNGYNPEQVDQLLVDLAAALDRDEAVDPTLVDLDGLEVVPAGYDMEEVKRFFDGFADFPSDSGDEELALPASTPTEDVPVIEPVADLEVAEDEETTAAEASEAQAATDSEPATDPEPAPADERDAAVLDSVQHLGDAAEGTLSHAVERTKQTVVELEVFLSQQFELAKAACDEAVAHTRDDCAQTMKTARSVAQAALTMTEDAAEELRGQTAAAISRISQDFERQLAFTQRTFQHNLEQCREQIAADLDRLIASSRSRADEITSDIDAVQAQVEHALADARSVLTAEVRRAA
jgi:DivIVA domain-containing protein